MTPATDVALARTWSPGGPSTWAARWARCVAGRATRRCASSAGRPVADQSHAGRAGDPAAGRPARRRRRRSDRLGSGGRLGAGRVAGAARRRRRPDRVRAAAPGAPRHVAGPPRLAGAAHRAGARVARAGGARAEGHRARGLAGLARAGAAVRRSGTRPGGPAAAGAGRRTDPATWRRVPSLGLAPRRRRPVPVAHDWSPPPGAPAGSKALPTGRRPKRPAAAVAARHRRVDRGRGRAARLRRRRRGVGRRLPPGRARSAGRWSGEPVDDDAMLELLEPYRGHRYRAVRMVELSGVHPPRRGPRYAGRDFRAM